MSEEQITLEAREMSDEEMHNVLLWFLARQYKYEMTDNCDGTFTHSYTMRYPVYNPPDQEAQG